MENGNCIYDMKCIFYAEYGKISKFKKKIDFLKKNF